MKKEVKRLSKEEVEALYELNRTDHAVLKYDLDVNYAGITAAQIGQLIGISEKQVHVIRNRPRYKRVVSELRKDAVEVLVDARNKCAHKLVEIALKGKSEGNSLRACEAVLGSVLTEKTSPKENREQTVILEDLRSKSTEELAAILQAEIEKGKQRA